MGVPNFDGGVAGGRNERSPTAANDDVVDPICVMLHGLDVSVLRSRSVPYSNDAISSCAEKKKTSVTRYNRTKRWKWVRYNLTRRASATTG